MVHRKIPRFTAVVSILSLLLLFFYLRDHDVQQLSRSSIINSHLHLPLQAPIPDGMFRMQCTIFLRRVFLFCFTQVQVCVQDLATNNCNPQARN